MKPVSTMLDGLRAAMLSQTGYAPDTIEANTQLTRFDTAKRGDKTGWYVCHLMPWGMVARFGNWREGYTHKWNSFEPSRLDKKQFAEFKRIQQEQAKARKAEQTRQHEAARLKAVSLWGGSKPANPEHHYLQKKRVGAYGIRQSGSLLIIPLIDLDGYLHNIQTIAPDGTKRFLSGGRKKSLFFPLSHDGNLINANGVIICEGYATGASYLEESHDVSVLVAYDAGNLLPVAQAFRARYPSVSITILADNDRKTPGNPGVTKATEAATAVQAGLIVPEFPDYAPSNLTDYNDWRNFWNDRIADRLSISDVEEAA